LATFLSGPVPGLHSRAPTLEYYFLVNREDGRSLPGAPTPGSSSFEVATVRYFRSTLHFAPFTRGDGSPLPGFTDWLGKAVLVKVVARAQPPPGEGSGPDGLPRP
jgi:hypothetical protein